MDLKTLGDTAAVLAYRCKAGDERPANCRVEEDVVVVLCLLCSVRSKELC